MPSDASTGLFVVITDFNGFQETRRCLAALRDGHDRGFRIVVVDHGTTADTREGLAREFPEVIRVAASPELWWAGATNAGVRCALGLGAEAILLLNSDCYATPGMLGELCGLWREDPESIVAPVQRDSRTGRIACIAPKPLFLLGLPTWIGPRRLSEGMQARRRLPVALINGGRGAVVPAGVFARVGLFDEKRLPHYGADHDFYLRARRLGIRLYTATRAIVDVDATRSSTAAQPGRLRLREFVDTLFDVRSHRNIPHMTQLFRLHYPIKHFHGIGVTLCAARYFVVYAFQRMRTLLSERRAARASSPR
jgi:GT2 family glycosyltransferase